jgi:hypothetical protein
MKPHGLRRSILLVAAFVVAGAGLLAEPASADQALFRLQYKFYGAKGTVTSPAKPSVGQPACGAIGAYCPALEVGTTTPAAKFTIAPKAFYSYSTYSYTGYAGYTSLTTLSSWNGKGQFAPSNPNLPTAYHRMVFPTTGGNPGKNPGSGYPVTATTTFGGAFDKNRAGSAKLTPGPNRFGGTIKFIFDPSSIFKQKIRTLTGYYSKATGSFYCQATAGSGPGARNGPLQPCASSDLSKVGVIGSSGMVSRKKYTSLGYVPIMTTMGVNALTYKAYYLSTFAPWTTGMIYAQNPLNYKNQKFTQTGYDKKFSVPTTRTFTYTNYNTTTAGTTTTTTMKTLMGITRITSMVRPRLRHTYLQSNNPLGAVTTPYQSARLWGLRVFQLPEPGGLVLLGAGILGLAGLSILRRR